MKFRNAWIRVGLWSLAAAAGWADALVIDHRHTDITQLTTTQIQRAKATLHIAYGHTSHGSQLTDGMSGLVDFADGGGKGLALPAGIFAWNQGGMDGALDLHDYAMDGDAGYYPDWVNNTLDYLADPAHTDVNVIVWSWCGQMGDKYAAGTLGSEYLEPMAALETTFPDVVFVYMTGHVDIWDDADNKAACEVIRTYCAQHGKVLYDFNDIEHYNPDGVYFDYVNDSCDYYTGPGTGYQGNWAITWQTSHVQGVDWYDCGAQHSEPLNANQKAYAAWALWCALGADFNRDGVPDEWADRYGGPQVVRGGTNDADRDGFTDAQEYIADTNPTNDQSRLRITGTAWTGRPEVTFTCTNSRRYRLEGRPGLGAGSWLPLGATNLAGPAGGSMTLADTNALERGLYRVGVTLP